MPSFKQFVSVSENGNVTSCLKSSGSYDVTSYLKLSENGDVTSCLKLSGRYDVTSGLKLSGSYDVTSRLISSRLKAKRPADELD